MDRGRLWLPCSRALAERALSGLQRHPGSSTTVPSSPQLARPSEACRCIAQGLAAIANTPTPRGASRTPFAPISAHQQPSPLGVARALAPCAQEAEWAPEEEEEEERASEEGCEQCNESTPGRAGSLPGTPSASAGRPTPATRPASTGSAGSPSQALCSGAEGVATAIMAAGGKPPAATPFVGSCARPPAELPGSGPAARLRIPLPPLALPGAAGSAARPAPPVRHRPLWEDSDDSSEDDDCFNDCQTVRLVLRSAPATPTSVRRHQGATPSRTPASARGTRTPQASAYSGTSSFSPPPLEALLAARPLGRALRRPGGMLGAAAGRRRAPSAEEEREFLRRAAALRIHVSPYFRPSHQR